MVLPIIRMPAEDWMGLGYAQRTDTELRTICIPGTHDSGSYAITGVDEKVSQTTEWTLRQQLDHGYRYLDLRIAWREEAFRMVHGISTSAPADEGLRDIGEFCLAHPREILILKLVPIGLDQIKRRELTDQLILPALGSFLAEPLGNAVTFGQLWEREESVILAWDGDDFAAYSDRYWHKASLIVEKWSNTDDVDFLIRDQQDFIRTVDRQGRFHVAQIVMTPGVKSFFLYGLGIQDMTYRELDHASFIIRLDGEARKAGQRVNIAMVDFPEFQCAFEACMVVNGLDGRDHASLQGAERSRRSSQ